MLRAPDRRAQRGRAQSGWEARRGPEACRFRRYPWPLHLPDIADRVRDGVVARLEHVGKRRIRAILGANPFLELQVVKVHVLIFRERFLDAAGASRLATAESGSRAAAARRSGRTFGAVRA